MKVRIWFLVLLLGCSGEQKTTPFLGIVSRLPTLEKPLSFDSDGRGFDKFDTLSVFKAKFLAKIFDTESYYGLISLRRDPPIPIILIFDKSGNEIDSLQLFPTWEGGTIYPPLGEANNSIWSRHKAEFLNDSIIDLSTETLSRRFDTIEGTPNTARDVVTGLLSKRYSVSRRGKIKAIDSLKVSPF
jgi:hypothetical protein